MERGYPGGSHAAARTAVVWDVLLREVARRAAATPRLQVVDVGGGTGGFAVPLAREGHWVTVVDASPDALAALTRRAAEAGVADRVLAVQGDADRLTRLIEPASADLVLCHNVLEEVDFPDACATALAAVLRPGGAASVVVANRVAAALARAMAGQLAAATALLDGVPAPAGQPDTVRRRFDLPGATELLERAGLVVEEVHGVRVVADLVPGSVLERDREALAAFERRASVLSPLRDIAAALHLLARRP